MTPGTFAKEGSTEEVEAFLRGRPPFQGLGAEALRRIAEASNVQALPRDTTIIEQGGDPAASLYVIRSGSVEIRNEGRVVDVPGEGEVFGELSLLTGLEPAASVVAHEDTVCYLIDAAVARELLGTPSGTAFVQASLKRVTASASEHVGATQVRTGIRTAEDAGAAISSVRGLPIAVAALVDAGADAVEIGRVVGSTVDALTRRLIGFAITDLGDPPVPWAWLAMGSQARLEQALHTDQDHALSYDAQGRTRDELDPYFAELAERVTGGLEAAGIPRCEGDAMAVTPGLRRSIEEWRDAYGRWMEDPGAQGSIFTSITFDFRAIAGPLEIEPSLEAIVRTARDNQPFLRHLTRRALDQSPPTGFKGHLVLDRGEHVGRLDIKHGGITIIGNIARTFSIRDGRTEKRTLDRLRAAEETGRIDRERREALEEAFKLLWQTRLEHQAAQVRQGVEPDEFVDPASLGPITRLGLKEAFRIVASEQKRLAGELAHY